MSSANQELLSLFLMIFSWLRWWASNHTLCFGKYQLNSFLCAMQNLALVLPCWFYIGLDSEFCVCAALTWNSMWCLDLEFTLRECYRTSRTWTKIDTRASPCGSLVEAVVVSWVISAMASSACDGSWSNSENVIRNRNLPLKKQRKCKQTYSKYNIY